MPKCPKCGAEIDYLHEFDKVEEKFRFSIDDNGLPDYAHLNYIAESEEVIDFECPECDALLFEDEEKATAFLKGEPIPAE